MLFFKIFIVRSYCQDDINNCAKAYQNTFAGAPWFEEWKLDDAKKIISQASQKTGFKSSIVTDLENEILAFAFGYDVPKNDTKTVAFSKIGGLLENINYDNAFYLAECGVVQNSQNQGLGTLLIQNLKKQDASVFVLRTISENMLKIVNKVYGNTIELFNDPQYRERVWYGTKNEN